MNQITHVWVYSTIRFQVIAYDERFFFKWLVYVTHSSHWIILASVKGFTDSCRSFIFISSTSSLIYQNLLSKYRNVSINLIPNLCTSFLTALGKGIPWQFLDKLKIFSSPASQLYQSSTCPSRLFHMCNQYQIKLHQPDLQKHRLLSFGLVSENAISINVTYEE